jgi:hypothetical protein
MLKIFRNAINNLIKWKINKDIVEIKLSLDVKNDAKNRY